MPEIVDLPIRNSRWSRAYDNPVDRKLNAHKITIITNSLPHMNDWMESPQLAELSSVSSRPESEEDRRLTELCMPSELQIPERDIERQNCIAASVKEVEAKERIPEGDQPRSSCLLLRRKIRLVIIFWLLNGTSYCSFKCFFSIYHHAYPALCMTIKLMQGYPPNYGVHDRIKGNLSSPKLYMRSARADRLGLSTVSLYIERSVG
ncbi:unnamed protein product [Ranitomeya imitator]|uniref:Uncharacterized protein n=1 Tax=Ranitomeya imitator TaxID=111125 RepID=A0ABN9M5G1_9NEOB|nr:unnamed protein product [Ranitomeya imitator]